MGILDKLFRSRKKRSYTGSSTGRLLNDFVTQSYAADSEIKANVKI